MSGLELKNKLDALGIQYTKLAEQLGMSQPNFSASLKVADIKTGFLEKICAALNLPITYFYGIDNEIHNTSVLEGYKENSDNTNSNIGTDNETMNRLLDELKALREQNTKLTDLLLNR